MNHNLLVGQSGGPTAVINGSLYGVVSEGLANPEIDNVIGMVNGIEGFLADHTIDMAPLKENGELERIRTTPGSYLGSCRYKLPENLDASVYTLLFEKFEQLNIGAVFYIGGNDSMDTADKLSRWAANNHKDISFIGVPKTIDNDLPVTDHTPGYGSAARYVASTVREIVLDASVYQQPAVTIVELMGRHAGWVTAASSLARKFAGDNPLLIYMPEAPFEMESFFTDLENALSKSTAVVVCISEGIRDASGNYISASESSVDTFGHSQLSGAGKTLEFLVKEKLGVKVRSVEVNVLQRCAAHLASKTDLDEAFTLGQKAVALSEEGVTASMVTIRRISDSPYEIAYEHAEIRHIANEAKSIPREWINDAGNDVTQPLIDYLSPLILGEVPVKYENGIPVYMDVSHLAKHQ